MKAYQRYSRDLASCRVGLSGAIPEPEAWGGRPLDHEIQEFVSSLSDGVLRHSGFLIHGSHPSFTPRILDRAQFYGEKFGRKVARFYMSAVFTESGLPQLVDRYANVAEMVKVPQVGEGTAADVRIRNASLTRMRQALIADMDVLVVVGGKSHMNTDFSPGTKQELDMAIGRGLPCFLVGGLGGMSAELATEYPPEVLGNGFLPEANQELQSTTDLNQAAGMIISALRSLRGKSSNMESKIKHLEFIQGVINRMAGNSFLLKGWSVTLVAALIVLGTKDAAKPEFVLLALLPALAFWFLDGYFLRQEQLFRRLYDGVRLHHGDVDFSMDTRPFMRPKQQPQDPDNNMVNHTLAVCFSRTLFVFHGAMSGAIVFIFLILKLLS